MLIHKTIIKKKLSTDWASTAAAAVDVEMACHSKFVDNNLAANSFEIGSSMKFPQSNPRRFQVSSHLCHHHLKKSSYRPLKH